MDKKFLWCTEKESFLIDLIKTRPALWNPSHVHYNRKTMKNLYCQLGKEMSKRWPNYASSFTAMSLQSKFGTLRSYFQREVKKLTTSEQEGFESSSKWVHYQRLNFLKDCSAIRSSQSNLDVNIEEESQPTCTSEGQPDAAENGSLPLTVNCRIKQEIVENETPEVQPFQEENSRLLSKLNSAIKEKIVEIETSECQPETSENGSLPMEAACNIDEEITSSEEESTAVLSASTKPPRKRRRRVKTNPSENILLMATSALEKLQSQQPENDYSVAFAMGLLVQTVLRNISIEGGREFSKELLVLISKHMNDPDIFKHSR